MKLKIKFIKIEFPPCSSASVTTMSSSSSFSPCLLLHNLRFKKRSESACPTKPPSLKINQGKERRVVFPSCPFGRLEQSHSWTPNTSDVCPLLSSPSLSPLVHLANTQSYFLFILGPTQLQKKGKKRELRLGLPRENPVS